MSGFVRRSIRAMERMIWPKAVQCLLCDELCTGEWLCRRCSEKLSSLRLEGEEGSFRSAYAYQDEARSLVLTLKHGAVRDAASALAPAMAEVAKNMSLPSETVVTWVAMPQDRFLTRGMDHGRRLAREVAELIDLPARNLLVRVKSTRTQQGLDASSRRENLIGAFACRRTLRQPVLIVDDVKTTGATLEECSRALIDSGVPEVYAVTAAKTMTQLQS